MKCAAGHQWVDCDCAEQAIVKQETSRTIVTGILILGIVLLLAGLVALF